MERIEKLDKAKELLKQGVVQKEIAKQTRAIRDKDNEYGKDNGCLEPRVVDIA